MYWACFLHIYQPPSQHPEVLERIVNESYRPLLNGIQKIKRAKVTLNINAVLTELLDQYGYGDVIEVIRTLAEEGRLEFTESGKYHAFFPLIPQTEIIRQIKLNHQTNRDFFGDLYQPRGIFSPEMSYAPKIADVAQELGYQYLLADEIAHQGQIGLVKFDRLYQIGETEVMIYFRQKKASNLIMGAVTRSVASIKAAVGDDLDYLVTAMDGETFGHHRVGLEEFLFDLLKEPSWTPVLISELPNLIKKVEAVMPLSSTWASSEQDLSEGNQFDLWFDRENTIHKFAWELTNLALAAVNESRWAEGDSAPARTENKRIRTGSPGGKELIKEWRAARHLLDQALHSCHYWWASGKPWWSLEMIEEGAFQLWQAIVKTPDASEEQKDAAEELYKKILYTAHSWQRTGYIRKLARQGREWQKIPFKKRAKPGEYEALLGLLKKAEKTAAQKGEYEQATKWRDAQHKLKNNLDVYDTIHIIDQLRAEADASEFEDLVQKYRTDYQKLNPGQPE